MEQKKKKERTGETGNRPRGPGYSLHYSRARPIAIEKTRSTYLEIIEEIISIAGNEGTLELLGREIATPLVALAQNLVQKVGGSRASRDRGRDNKLE